MDLNVKMNEGQLRKFAEFLEGLSDEIGFRVSSRGWGYILEQRGMITKDQFDKVEDAVNRCRKKGYLPVDFVAEESSRAFSCVHRPTPESYAEHIEGWVEASLDCHKYFEPDWWAGEKYYIQMVVEKIDLVTLFHPLCELYHIPLANSKGWSSILQRAEYCRRFQEAEGKGLRCVLLYCGDHDPDGLRISETLRKNLEDVADVRWADGAHGYDPSSLTIERFGLEYDFIIQNNLTWIDNLITGSGKDLGSPAHPNHSLPYVQDYLANVGQRKCEANSVVVVPKMGRQMCEDAILKYLGKNARQRFAQKRINVKDSIQRVLEDSGAKRAIEDAMELLRNHEE